MAAVVDDYRSLEHPSRIPADDDRTYNTWGGRDSAPLVPKPRRRRGQGTKLQVAQEDVFSTYYGPLPTVDTYASMGRLGRRLVVNSDQNASIQPEDASSEKSARHDGMSVAGAVFNKVCTSVGTGLLALPSALRVGGWFGVITIMYIGMCAGHTAVCLCDCMFVDSKRGDFLTTYTDIARISFKKAGFLQRAGPVIVTMFQMFVLFGVAAIFMILIAANLHGLFPSVGMHIFVVAVGAVLTPFSWLKTMKEISILAFFGVAASIIVGIAIIALGVYRAADPSVNSGDSSFFVLEGLPVAFSTVVFSFGGHSVLPTIVTEMANPRDYKKAVNYSFFLMSSIYVMVAAAGYAGWGDLAADNIILSKHSAGHVQDIVFNISNIVITLHVLLAYPLPLNPICLYAEAILKTDDSPHEFWYRIVLRSCLAWSTMLIALLIPFFGDVLTLVSAFSIIAMVFVFPIFFYVANFWKVMPMWHKLFLGKIMLVALAACGTGVYYAIQSLVSDIQSSPNPFANFWKH